MENFKERRDAILSQFQQAHGELEQLNKEISIEIENRAAQVDTLRGEMEALEKLKSSNTSSIKTFSKFLK
jgi:flagellar hook-associated protein FlgK